MRGSCFLLAKKNDDVILTLSTGFLLVYYISLYYLGVFNAGYATKLKDYESLYDIMETNPASGKVKTFFYRGIYSSFCILNKKKHLR